MKALRSCWTPNWCKYMSISASHRYWPNRTKLRNDGSWSETVTGQEQSIWQLATVMQDDVVTCSIYIYNILYYTYTYICLMFHFVHVLVMAGPIFKAVFPTFGIKPRNNKKTWKKLSTRSWLESDEFPINLTLYMQREGHSGRRIFPNAQPLEVNLRLNIWCPGVPPEFLNHAAKIWREVSSQFETQHQVYCHPERKGDFGPVNKFLFQRGTWSIDLIQKGMSYPHVWLWRVFCRGSLKAHKKLTFLNSCTKQNIYIVLRTLERNGPLNTKRCQQLVQKWGSPWAEITLLRDPRTQYLGRYHYSVHQ